jgi:general secretion pathway protein N
VKRVGWLIALGIGTLLLFALATLPAGIAAGRLEKVGVQAGSFAGSIWNGSASALTWRNAPIGTLEWHLAPMALLRGRLAGHARLARDDGKLETDFSASFVGDAQLSSTTFDLPGTIDLDDLVTPPPRNASVGGFHVVLPHPKPQGEGSLPDHLTARVNDKQGPFSVDGQLSIGKDHSFLLEGMVAARGEVPENMRQSLEILGPPDAAGRRPFSVSGTL